MIQASFSDLEYAAKKKVTRHDPFLGEIPRHHAAVGIDLNREAAKSASTLLKFLRLLIEEHKLTERIFASINTLLADRGLILKEGSIVDVMNIAAPYSIKNQGGERDPEMHHTKKGSGNF